MTPETRAVIAITEPLDATADIGYSRGWACRILRNRIVIGEAYKAPTPARAFADALTDMEARVAA
jgi:hypothetical protein